VFMVVCVDGRIVLCEMLQMHVSVLRSMIVCMLLKVV
jgi:hypothetical protein